ncbi:MAG: ATP-dependent DNA helicase RecG [Verrucomicrobiota bacterium]
MQSPPKLNLDSSVVTLPGVGPETAKLLGRLGIETVGQLLLHAPRKYEDRRNCLAIVEISQKELVCVQGTVVELGLKKFARGFKSVLQVVIDDGTARLHCRWWNLPYLEKNFSKGQHLLVSGKVRDLKPRTIDHPEVEPIEEGDLEMVKRIVPVYPLTEGITQRTLRRLISEALDRVEIAEHYPADLLMGRLSRAQAIRYLHFPEEMWQPAAARERLALDEYIKLQLVIQARRRALEKKAPRLPCPGDNRLIKKFLPTLGFQLTDAQTEALRDIRQDFINGIPMRRLLQGDVGSGKTLVAACSALMVIESGYNVALMAPTEILAEQHYRNFQKWFNPLGIEVKIWTGSAKSDLAPESDLFEENREPMILIGTHALIQSKFRAPNLGYVIIDEQHRFGVTQREAFVRKGHYPHLLVMTATPIPRTLGLTLYGDLDHSLMRHSPAGRQKVKTFVRTADKLEKVWSFLAERLAQGEQSFIVYPRVENDTTGKAVLKEFGLLKTLFPNHRVAAMHGKLSGADKERIMTEFRANKIQILVASSLIEVGVDVPNATTMVIENAEQFGLAQLHQLRGRIGRGTRPSYCILISTANDPESEERLRVLEKTSDGFEIAEADMRFRGPGELIGQAQSGMPDLKFGNLLTDFDLVREARRIGIQILKAREEKTAT